MITVDKFKETDFSYSGSSYENNSLIGFLFRVKNESADTLREKYNIYHKHMFIYHKFAEDLYYVEGYTDPSCVDALQTILTLEDKNIIKEILQSILKKENKVFL